MLIKTYNNEIQTFDTIDTFGTFRNNILRCRQQLVSIHHPIIRHMIYFVILLFLYIASITDDQYKESGSRKDIYSQAQRIKKSIISNDPVFY